MEAAAVAVQRVVVNGVAKVHHRIKYKSIAGYRGGNTVPRKEGRKEG